MALDVFLSAEKMIKRNQDFYSEIHSLKLRGSSQRSTAATGLFSENQITCLLRELEVDQKYGIFSGLIKKGATLSSQVDIIITNKVLSDKSTVLGSFILADHADVKAIIEVKSGETDCKGEINQIANLKPFYDGTNNWIIWIDLHRAIRNTDQKIHYIIKESKSMGVRCAIVAAYRKRRKTDTRPSVIDDPWPEKKEGYVYHLNPEDLFSDFIQSMRKL